MRDDFRPKFKPEEPEVPQEQPRPESSWAEATLAEDHPFARLAGHDPRLMRAMGAALQVLKENTNDDELRKKLELAAKGRLEFRDLLNDRAFTETYPERSDSTSATLERVKASEDDERAAARAARAKAHVERLTKGGEVVSEVNRALGHLAP